MLEFNLHQNNHQPESGQTEHLVDLREVVKTCRSSAGVFTALKGIDLQVESGAFVSIIGKSGSGKSTLINVITGIDKPTSGEVIVDKIPIHKFNEEQIAIPMSQGLNEALGQVVMGVPLTYSYSMPGLWLWLGIVIILSMLASFIPARNASRLTVREVLAYE